MPVRRHYRGRIYPETSQAARKRMVLCTIKQIARVIVPMRLIGQIPTGGVTPTSLQSVSSPGQLLSSMASHTSSAFWRFMNSPTGPRTVHFWAPVMKWSLVIAGAKDLNRPVEKVSGTQQIALTATGLIWTRWCMIIKPRNYLLASVNFFLGCVAGFQLIRVYNWNRSLGYSFSETVQNMFSPPETPREIAIDAAVEAPK
ncbi:Mitochondrial pyruvate carrier 3 [Wickerhamiella sorbophila]|uniref:Mitochondrial pyruvate carrier n=1 Tax=Wickerhamiella sorbophila TaxID=45607 RepID=A0A2T0FL95_9ASCO|nr:Mitochondrial pyruvate carrier 3 [Wickerhamiella sorbophila]PRT55764.1 Mitochondrial pyruvate carrier 3 [Wickerhamiella sorbophila]